MRLFGRKKGRHALGAAVTSIPSGPVQGAVSPPVAAPAATAAVPPPVVVPAGEPDLMTSIAELIASGEAWATEASVEKLPPLVSTPHRAPTAETSASSAPPPPAVAHPVIHPSDVGAAVEPVRRVQLGFRDGTSTTLDPASTQALALEELAQTLTRRD